MHEGYAVAVKAVNLGIYTQTFRKYIEEMHLIWISSEFSEKSKSSEQTLEEFVTLRTTDFWSLADTNTHISKKHVPPRILLHFVQLHFVTSLLQYVQVIIRLWVQFGINLQECVFSKSFGACNFNFLKNSQMHINSKLNEKNRMIAH